MLRLETGETPALVGRRGAKRLAARVEVGRCGLRLREFGLRALKFSPGARLALARFSREAVRPIGGLGQRQVLGGEPLRHGGGVGDQRLLALEVAGELTDAALELGFALLGALLLGLERVARERDPVQRRAAARLLFAQGRKGGGGDRLQARGLGLRARALGNLEKVGVEPLSRLGEMGLVPAPGEEMGERLVTADVGGEIAVTARLARLTLQAVDLDVELLQHVLNAQKVVLRPFQPQLRLMAARVQAGDARGLLEDEPARLGLGGNDFADLALAHERGRTRAGRGVGEEELHVARAHLLAVDAIGRARLALDAPRNLDRLGVVERGGRAAVGIVEQEGDFALLREGRLPEPPKMTSSMPEPRMFLNAVSPITQRSASTKFDLPQPLGPTTPVRPGSILKSAESQKLLKPVRRKRSNFIVAALRPLSRRAEAGTPCGRHVIISLHESQYGT